MFEKALSNYIEKFGYVPQIAKGRGSNNKIAIVLMDAVDSNTPLSPLDDSADADL